MLPTKHARVLAVYPTTRGFGWVIFEGPLAAVDWGAAHASADRPARLLKRFVGVMRRYRPETVLFETYSNRVPRIVKLCEQLTSFAEQEGATTISYPESLIREHFAAAGARTRHDIADAIARRLPALSHRLPAKRKPWLPVDARRSLFDAAAVALTHYAVAPPA